MRHCFIRALHGFSNGSGPINTKFAKKSASFVQQHCAWALKTRGQQTYKHNQCPLLNSNQHRKKKVTINLH